MKKICILFVLFSMNLMAKTMSCASEFYPDVVQVSVDENQAGIAQRVVLTETIKDMSGPKDIITKKVTVLFGGKDSVGKNRKAYSFNLSPKEFESDEFKELKTKFKTLPKFEKGSFTVITNFGNKTGKDAREAAKMELKLGSPSISYLSLKDKSGNTSAATFLGWSGYFINCK